MLRPSLCDTDTERQQQGDRSEPRADPEITFQTNAIRHPAASPCAQCDGNIESPT